MKTNEVASYLGIATSTLRQWTLYDYKKFLTDSAKGDGQRRNFEPLDIRILSYVNSLKDDNKTNTEIIEILEGMQENDWQSLPEVDDIEDELSAVEKAISNAEIRVEEREKALRFQISTLAGEIRDLRDDLKIERSTNIELRDKIASKERELGVAQGELNEYKRRDQQQNRLWIALVAVAVAAAVVLAVLVTITLNVP